MNVKNWTMPMQSLIRKMRHLISLALIVGLTVVGCGGEPTLPPSSGNPLTGIDGAGRGDYRIGAGDMLSIFVWRNPEISTQVPVRPDGKISTPLVEDMVAVGKTPSQLARDMEEVLSRFIKSPSVNVIVSSFEGVPGEQIRVVGQAANPQAVSFRQGMTVLDVVIAVGGLGEFAAGNRAKLVRRIDGKPQEFRVRLDDLINEGDISQNIQVQPGDILIIPEAFF